MSDKVKLIPNPQVPSLFGAPPEGGRNFRPKKDVAEMAQRVGKQWEHVPKKDLVPLPESPTSKAKPKVMANLPGVRYQDTPTMLSAAAISNTDTHAKGGWKPPQGSDDNQTPSLFAGSKNYFNKATGGDKK